MLPRPGRYCLMGRIAADLRRAGAGRIDWIQPVNVERDICRPVTGNLARQRCHFSGSQIEVFLNSNNPDALFFPHRSSFWP